MEGGKDSGEGASEVVEDGKGAELASAALLGNGKDLRELAGDTEDAGTRLKVAEELQVENAIGKEGTGGAGEDGDKDGGEGGAVAVVEEEDGDDDVLGEDEGGLAVGAKGKAVAIVVGEGDEVGARLEDVGEEADAVGGVGADKLEDLGDLDDGGCANDADAEALGDAELETSRVFEVDVEEDGLVALLADDGDAEVADRAGEVVGDGLEGGAEGVHGVCVCVCVCEAVGGSKNY